MPTFVGTKKDLIEYWEERAKRWRESAETATTAKARWLLVNQIAVLEQCITELDMLEEPKKRGGQ